MMRIISEPITKIELSSFMREQFPDMVKGVVDVEREVMAVGGELHADEEALLLKDGSRQEDLWGINFHFDWPEDQWIEFDSMINIRPAHDNRSRGVENPEVRGRILKVVDKLIRV